MKKYKILICLLLILSLIFGSIGSAYANPVAAGAVGVEGYLLIGGTLVSLGVITDEEWQKNSEGVIELSKEIQNRLSGVDKAALDVAAKGVMAYSSLGMAKFEIPDDLFSNIRSKFFDVTGISPQKLSGSYGGGYTGLKASGVTTLLTAIKSIPNYNYKGGDTYGSYMTIWNGLNYPYKMMTQNGIWISYIYSNTPITFAYNSQSGNVIASASTGGRIDATTTDVSWMPGQASVGLRQSGGGSMPVTPSWGGASNTNAKIITSNFSFTLPAPFGYGLSADEPYPQAKNVSISADAYTKLMNLTGSGTGSVCVNLPTNLDPVRSNVSSESISADTLIGGLKTILDSLKKGSISIGGSVVTGLPDIVLNPDLPTTANPPISIPTDVPATGTGTIADIFDTIKDFFNPRDFNLDFKPLKVGLTKVFPFCIPFDFSRMVSVFSATPTDFKFKIDLDTVYFKVHHTVDLTSFRLPIMFFRYVVIIMFSYILISRTRSMMKW